jgi:hypothetical protein
MEGFFGQLKQVFEMGYCKSSPGAPEVVEVKPGNRFSVYEFPEPDDFHRLTLLHRVSTRNRPSVLSHRKSFVSNRKNMMSNTSPKVPSWEVIVDQHLKQCLRAAKARDFTYFKLSAALNAKPEAEQINYKATLFSITFDELPIEELEGLNSQTCDEIARNFQEFFHEVEKAKDEHLDWLAWGRLLDSEDEKAMDRIVSRVESDEMSRG